MFSEITNPTLTKKKIMQKMAEVTGVNNDSRSSIMSGIAESVSGVISDSVKYSNGIVNSTYTEYAVGETLTNNAIEFGVIRDIYSDIYVDEQDAAIAIEPENGIAFPRFSDGKIAIKAGKQYQLGGSTIEVLKDVYISTSESSIPVSARVISNSQTDIKTNTSIDIFTKDNPYTSGVVLRFKKPIHNRLYEETDEQLRGRVFLSKSKVHGSSNMALYGIISSIPLIKHFHIEEDSSAGVTRVFVATSKTMIDEEEQNFGAIVAAIRSRADYKLSAEQRVEVHPAEVIRISPLYTYKNISEEMAMSAMADSFNQIYTPFSKSISIDELNKKIIESGVGVTVDRFIVSNKRLGIIGSQSEGILSIDGPYITVFSGAEAQGAPE